MRRRFPISLLVLLILPTLLRAQYVARQWNIEDGLPQSSVRCITQTHDGYLWIGTWNGLARFDGIRMAVFNAANTPDLHPSITSIHEDRSRRLWIGTDGGGLCQIVDGTVVRIDTASGYAGTIISAMNEDSAGRMWFATEAGISVLNGERFIRVPYAPGFPNKSITGILPRPDSSVYLELVDIVFHVRLSGDSLVVLDKPFHTGGYRVDQDSAGALWYGFNGKGLVRRMGSMEHIDGPLTHVLPEQVFIPRNQEKWLVTPLGPYVLTPEGMKHLQSVDGIDLSNVSYVFEDREDILWLGVSGSGLIRLMPKQVQVFASTEGIEGGEVMCGMEDRSGNVWIGTWTGGLSSRKFGFGGSFSPVPLFTNGMTIMSVCQSADGTMWVGTWGRGVYTIRGRSVKRVLGTGLDVSTTIRAIVSDTDGSVWIAGVYGALWHVANGTITMWNSKNGLTGKMANSLLVTRSGEVWMGTEGGGVARLMNGRISFLRKSDGLIDEFSHVSIEDDSGAVWLTSKHGIQRWKNGVFSSVTAKQGFDDDPAQFIQDDDGDYWIGGTHGIHRVRGRDLNAAADGTISTLSFLTIGKADGMPVEECSGGNNQHVWKTRDGALWFSTTHGAVRLEPRSVASNPIPPGVIIEQVQVEHRSVLLEGEIVLQPGQTKIEFHYTGINFAAPQQIRFSYMLEGFEKEWRDAGTDRYAQYTNLDPGHYIFRVKAANNAGIWSTSDAIIGIHVLPPFWQTWWFNGLAVMFFLTVGPTIYVVRVRSLKKERERQAQFSRRLMQTQETERQRIANELHDSLGQNLLVLKNRILVAQQDKKNGESLGDMSELVSQTIEEVRSISHNLRPHQLDQLGATKTIQALAKNVAESSGISMTLDCDDIDSVLKGDEDIALFRIVQESLNNVVKHSGATQLHVSTKKRNEMLEVVIGDNGKGMDVTERESQEEMGSGFGLSGIRERARMYGWKLNIDSQLSRGTTITVSIPLRTV